MNLVTLIVIGVGVALGWYANDNKKKLKAWVQKILRKSNEKVKNL